MRREADLHSSERARLRQELSALRAQHEQALERGRQDGEQRLSELHAAHAEERARLQRELSSLQVCVQSCWQFTKRRQVISFNQGLCKHVHVCWLLGYLPNVPS